jgi:ectoine hydroxylase
MSQTELTSYTSDGFLLRHNAFSDTECDIMAGDCEALFKDLERRAPADKVRFGNYLFENREEIGVLMKWEPDEPDLIQGIEPFVHMSEALDRWSRDPRIVEPCKDIVGEVQLALFTEKINYKRARKGGDYILHQDRPYWDRLTPAAQRVATAMIMLDDATVDNGCLEVAPGSHLEGEQPRWEDGGGREKEIDTSRFDLSRLVPVEAPRGSMILFGSMLVHRSAPNRTGEDRRALLYSYQPASLPHAREVKRQWRAERQAAEAASSR